MPDISMCTGGLCQRKADCERHAAQPSAFMQSWFSVVPVTVDDAGVQHCDYFMERHRKVRKPDWRKIVKDRK